MDEAKQKFCLTGLERDKIVADYKELLEKIADLMDILARPERVTEIIGEELAAIRDQFGDDRRSEIVAYAQDLGIEDLITPQDMVVTLSHTGYIKSQPLADYRAQVRGYCTTLAALFPLPVRGALIFADASVVEV